MADVSGDSALLVEAGDASALADAIDEAVRGGPGVGSRIAAGLRVAESHTWEASARGHLDAYRLAVERARSGPSIG